MEVLFRSRGGGGMSVGFKNFKGNCPFFPVPFSVELVISSRLIQGGNWHHRAVLLQPKLFNSDFPFLLAGTIIALIWLPPPSRSLCFPFLYSLAWLAVIKSETDGDERTLYMGRWRHSLHTDRPTHRFYRNSWADLQMRRSIQSGRVSYNS